MRCYVTHGVKETPPPPPPLSSSCHKKNTQHLHLIPFLTSIHNSHPIKTRQLIHINFLPFLLFFFFFLFFFVTLFVCLFVCFCFCFCLTFPPHPHIHIHNCISYM
ncbi:hypothetical protein, unlikely [Trypanosoma brucei gambiense DAL972]|uniref:Uncharacterized protein n=1 Tax=Trypanosoma brucei gambiense (strain MHOM/CI/86/DAL972) TaxID=679716 RepID=D0A5I0_TRYB9|nr:hypothetical protein, unlikely [Trypanosoma brucei gambiense DAL972]CBH16931.1 hypothetical protein, unlikely [Trypanosoma brucei gambiense DAL972]|eukprot:XP_011779195.1 hypothetical protein, unlikely [Trypanosoma brucei gambiense DAL972]